MFGAEKIETDIGAADSILAFKAKNSGDGLRLVDRIGSMLPDLSSIVEGDTADSALAHL